MTSNKLFGVLVPILKIDMFFNLVEMAPKVDVPKRLVIVSLIRKIGENALDFVHHHVVGPIVHHRVVGPIVHQHPMVSTPMHLNLSIMLP
jgi:hypothetical protein